MNTVNSTPASGNLSVDPVPLASRLFAIFLGLAVPSVVFGRVVFAVFVGLALVSLFFCRSWRDILRDLVAQCRTPVGILVLLTFVAWLPNTFISNFPMRSFEAVSRTLMLVGIASAFCSCLSSDRRLFDISLQTFMVISAISAAFALISMLVLPEIFWAIRLQGWLSQPIGTKLKGFSALAVLIVPVLVLTGYRFSRKWKVMSAISSAAYLAIVWESYNRSAMAGFLAMVVAVIIAILVRRGSKRSVLVSLSGFGVIAAGLIVWLRTSRGHWEAYMSRVLPEAEWFFPVWLVDFERQTIWSRALEFATVSPWFGIGANTINFVPGADAIIPGTTNLHVIPAHPHSWVIEVFAELGAVGLTLLLITIIVLTWQFLLKWRHTGQFRFILAIAIMAGYWGSGLFNFSYWSAWWQMSFLISLALVLQAKIHTHSLDH